MGTAVGNRLYAQGGWVASGSVSVGFVSAALLVCFARGPWEKGWVGWSGGWGLRRRDLGSGKKEEPAVEQALDEVSAEEQREEITEDERISSSQDEGLVEDAKRIGGEKTDSEEYGQEPSLALPSASKI